MAFLKETKGSLRAFFILVGIIYIAKLNVVFIAFGLIYIYFSFALEKLLPTRQKLVTRTIYTVFILNTILFVGGLIFLDITAADAVAFGIILLFTIYLVRNVKRISAEQVSIQQ